MSINPAQVRAGRGWLGWSQEELAAKAHVGISTVRDFEAGKRTPMHNNVVAIQAALEAGGAADFLRATEGLAPAPAIGDGDRGAASGPTTAPGRESAPGKRKGTAAGGSRGKRSPRSAR